MEITMRFATKSLAGAALAGGLLLAGGLAPAQAANNSQQSGLVNVSVGDVTVPIGVAANIVANVCPGVSVGNVAVIATQIARTGGAHTFCTAATGPVTVSQVL
jgi:hypothetical protein